MENSRIRITTPVDESSRPVIELVVRSLGTPMQKSGPLISGSDISYVLFNEARNEAVFLQPQMTHVKAEPVITPLLTHGQYRYRFPIDSATLAGMPDPQAWAKQSRLAVVAWERVESWPVEYVHIMRQANCKSARISAVEIRADCC